MFISTNNDYSFSAPAAGAVSTEDMNAYQVGGGVLIVATVGACTLGGTVVAPLPVLGGLALGTGLAVFGDRFTKEDAEAAKKSDKKSADKAEATAAA